MTYTLTDGRRRKASANVSITVVGALPLSGVSKEGAPVVLDPFTNLPGARHSGLEIIVIVPTPSVHASAATKKKRIAVITPLLGDGVRDP